MPKAHAPWVLARRPAIDTLDNTMAHTRSRTFPGRSTAIAGAALLVATGACAQVTTLEQVTVTGRSTPAPTVGGWGDVPLSQLPFSASVTTSEQMRDRAITRLADVVRLDPSASDAYNAVGYWDYLTLRGFVIDNRFNYRRDGLPISAETSIALDNKERIELLKGASGLQAGTSAPGGLVNFVVKRPLQAPLRSVQLGLTQRGSVSAAADINQRFGAGDAFGLRLNAAAEHLDPQARNAKGERHLLALAGDWKLSTDTLLEVEFESSHRSQPSVPGFSLLGPVLPSPADPRINLNNQPWSLPVVLDGNTASLRFSQALGAGWRWTAHAATQQLKSQDRVAFPYGFDCHPSSNFTLCDRYSPAGEFDLYDFRSENERRRTDALELALHGAFSTGGLTHATSVGLLRSQVRNRFQMQAFNYVGSGNVLGTAFTAADATLTDQNTNRDERSTEFFARDAVKLTERVTAWLGLRHTQLHRESVRTNGSRATAYDQSFNAPSLAASLALDPHTMLYAAWSRGVESEVAPNRARYTNRGIALPALQSRQIEIGIKRGHPDFNWSVAGFDIERPAWEDIGSDCSSDTPGGTCTRQADGVARHQGLEANAAWQHGAWNLQGGVQWLHARRQGSVNAGLNGNRPTNVPITTVRIHAGYDMASIPGLSLAMDLLSESNRMVLTDNSLSVPGYARFDTSLRYAASVAGTKTVWRAGVDNLFDRRAWKESPLQFGHVYLFPLAARTLRMSMEASW